MRRPIAGFDSAHRFLSFTFPISFTENSNQAVRRDSPARARRRNSRKTVPVTSGPGGVPT